MFKILFIVENSTFFNKLFSLKDNIIWVEETYILKGSMLFLLMACVALNVVYYCAEMVTYSQTQYTFLV
jgi:hypothetical protein